MARLLIFVFACTLLACDGQQKRTSFPAPSEQTYADYAQVWPDELTRELYRDKVLGMLVGSAIGDAMGAPTEMWHRNAIRERYGFVADFTTLDRPRSPEGPWGSQMQAGVTTDDTRWKFLFTQFLSDQKNQLDPVESHYFADFISDAFRQETKELSDAEMSAQAIGRELTHITWLQEWAAVAGPYSEGKFADYQVALNKFYGGEMACAGMLYAPVLGVIYPSNPNKAYINAYSLGLFDIGYARDISALTAAFVARAIDPNVSYDEILNLSTTVDPYNYGESRLIGRIADQYVATARAIIDGVKEINSVPDSFPAVMPGGYPDDLLSYYQLTLAYGEMDMHLKDIPFHAGEIHFINAAGLAWSQGDFQKAMQFVTNYGRDNDTVAAVTGAILGAYVGATNLPSNLSAKILKITRDVVGIDLEELADQLVEVGYRGGGAQ